MIKTMGRLYKDFCPCKQWQSVGGEKKAREFITEAMKYKPGICPFCGNPIQQKLFYTDVKIYSGKNVDYYEFITLKELKELLDEVKSG